MVLTILSLVIGYLTLSVSTALLYATWLSGAGNTITPEFIAFASVCSLGFAALSGWLAALVAQRAPITHAMAFSLMLAIIWGFYTFTGDPKEPLPLSLLNLAVGVTGIMAGGWIRLIQMQKRDQIRERLSD
ncbi:MAG: hypothetical protein AB8B99_22600 [Phormidesmis sp.]